MSYFVVEIDPTAEYEWNRLCVRNPIDGSNPKLDQLVGAALEGKPGHYLAKITVTVEVLEHQPLQVSENAAENGNHLAYAEF